MKNYRILFAFIFLFFCFLKTGISSDAVNKESKVTVANWGNGKAYFFKGNEYIRFDISADKADPGYPKNIDSKSWNGLPWTNGVDAVVNWGNGKAYFFKGNEYLRWDITTDKADPGYPKHIDSKSWNGLPWTDGVDAVVNWGNGKAYFFKGNEYVRWDIKTDKADPGYPKPIDSKSWNGLPWTNGVDAVVNWGNGKAYFFKGNEYVRWDIKTDKADPGYPKTIDSKSWNGLIWTNSINVADNSGDIKKSSSIGIDAVDNWGNGKAYFFKGNEYIRFDISADKADPGYPKKIDSKSWNGLPWTNGVDAVVNWGNGKAYFFKGNEYLRWDITTDKADPGYPKPIDSKSWNGLPWTNGVDAVVNWGNGKAYFFKGNEYVRFDITTDKADPGYPKPIDSKSWNGLPWTNGVDAVVNWGNGKAYFFKGNEYIRWDIKTDKADPGYPKKIDDKSWPGLWK